MQHRVFPKGTLSNQGRLMPQKAVEPRGRARWRRSSALRSPFVTKSAFFRVRGFGLPDCPGDAVNDRPALRQILPCCNLPGCLLRGIMPEVAAAPASANRSCQMPATTVVLEVVDGPAAGKVFRYEGC